MINSQFEWALTEFGKDKLQAYVNEGMDRDLAFELLNRDYSELEIYDFDKDEEDVHEG